MKRLLILLALGACASTQPADYRAACVREVARMTSSWPNPLDERSHEFWIENCQRQQVRQAGRRNSRAATFGTALIFGAASNAMFENRYGFPRQAITGSHWDTGF